MQAAFIASWAPSRASAHASNTTLNSPGLQLRSQNSFVHESRRNFRGECTAVRRLQYGWRSLRSILAFFWVMQAALIASWAPSRASAHASNIMTLNSTLRANMNQSLLSPGGIFELGFYAGRWTGEPNPVYTLAIWYAHIISPVKTVVWIANRSMNLSSSSTSATLLFSAQGELQVYNSGDLSAKPLWKSSTTQLQAKTAALLDSGNFVLLNASNQVVWQSFDTPTDTLLPGQQFSASANMKLYSWQKKNADWRQGRYSLEWNNQGYNYLGAYWNSPYDSFSPLENYWQFSAPLYNVTLTSNGVFLGTMSNSSTGNITTVIGQTSNSNKVRRLRRVTLDADGNLRMYTWVAAAGKTNSNGAWNSMWQAVSDNCTISGICGPYAICKNGQCSCPVGYELVNSNDTTQGCTMTNPVSSCPSENNPYLSSVGSVDYPQPSSTNDFLVLTNVTLDNCTQPCLTYCFCLAVTVSPLTSTPGMYDCWLKKKILLNGRVDTNRITYIRIVDPAIQGSGLSHWQKLLLGVTVASSVFVLLCVLLACYGGHLVSRKLRERRVKELEAKWTSARGRVVKFSYEEIRLVTNDFADEIGRGGYGSVFKGRIGRLADRVAVKQLDKNHSGREKDFVTEVDIIGRIHHANLVRLLGCCTSGNRRVLVYEYMENMSLDRLLFHQSNDSNHSKPPGGLMVLEWRSRFRIALEAARGLAYLHEEVSEKKIIHCDVKPENILLDSRLLAKVADFGVLRVLNKEQTSTMTMHIRGTFGYLAPEWTSDHIPISSKLDVYSFGMVLLEIVSGRRNLRKRANSSNNINTMPELGTSAADESESWYFPLWAFPKLESGSFLEVVDPLLGGLVDPEQVERALLVAFWCINEAPEVRPSMAKVVQLLEGNIPVARPVPRPNFLDHVLSSSTHEFNRPSTSSSGSMSPATSTSEPPPSSHITLNSLSVASFHENSLGSGHSHIIRRVA